MSADVGQRGRLPPPGCDGRPLRPQPDVRPPGGEVPPTEAARRHVRHAHDGSLTGTGALGIVHIKRLRNLNCRFEKQ